MKILLRTPMIAITTLLVATLFSGCVVHSGTTSKHTYYEDYSYNNPAWAPAYYTGARYYYFPDIECYYDLTSRDFIILNRGHWMFVSSIVPYYSTFDLYTSYIVIINKDVYQPWMHHQYYNSHYPRYYYIDYYDYSNVPYVRGFNENSKSAVYWAESERNKARQWDDRNIQTNRKFTYSNSDRRVQQETTQRVNKERAAAASTAGGGRNSSSRVTDTSTTVDRNSRTNTRPETTTTRRTDSGQDSRSSDASSTGRTQSTTRSTDTNYYGSPIGTPVRVESQMRRTETSTSSRTTSSSNSQRTSSSSSSSSDSGRSNSTSSSRR